MDDLEKESLTGLQVTNVKHYEPPELTFRQKTTKFAIKGKVTLSPCFKLAMILYKICVLELG